jgi:hypothetical protein
MPEPTAKDELLTPVSAAPTATQTEPEDDNQADAEEPTTDEPPSPSGSGDEADTADDSAGDA